MWIYTVAIFTGNVRRHQDIRRRPDKRPPSSCLQADWTRLVLQDTTAPPQLVLGTLVPASAICGMIATGSKQHACCFTFSTAMATTYHVIIASAESRSGRPSLARQHGRPEALKRIARPYTAVCPWHGHRILQEGKAGGKAGRSGANTIGGHNCLRYRIGVITVLLLDRTVYGCLQEGGAGGKAGSGGAGGLETQG